MGTTTKSLCVTNGTVSICDNVLPSCTYSSLYVASGATLTLRCDLNVKGSFINEGTINGSFDIIIVRTNTNGCSPPSGSIPYSNSGTIDLCNTGQFNYSGNSSFINKGSITASLYKGTGSITNENGGTTKTCQ